MPRTVGVVIPCKNEVGTLERCLRALRDQQPAPMRVVVVDNGSTDGSVEIARRRADVVLEIGQGTIGSLRNAGARALGDVDVIGFVDADVEVAPGWVAAGLAALADANIVGSRTLAPADATWVAARWAAIEAATAHEGSSVWTGNMLVDRATFLQLGGFDETLATAEDSDFSARAVVAGRVVRVAPEMRAVHHGFPAALSQFWRRERWHTRQPGWLVKMSPKSRLLVAAPLPWALLGGSVAASAFRGRGMAPLLGWSALTLAAVPALGTVVGAKGTDRWRDGILLGFWASTRATRLPEEVLAAAGRGSARAAA